MRLMFWMTLIHTELKQIGGRPKQVYEVMSNSGQKRCGMWDFPTLPLTSRPNKFHGRAYHVSYTRTIGARYHVRNHVPTQKLKLIGGRTKQVSEAMSNSRLRRFGMWGFPIVALSPELNYISTICSLRAEHSPPIQCNN